MTVREEYENMKRELRSWNRKNSWDSTKRNYHIEHCTKRAKTMFLNLLNRDFENIQFDMKYGFLTAEEFNQEMKLWNDCSNSIANMVIY